MFSLRRQNIPPLDLEAGVTVSGRPLPISAKFLPSTMSPVLEVQPPAFAQSEYYSVRPATEYLQALAKPCMFSLVDAFLPRFVIAAKEVRAGVVAGRMHMRSKCRRTGKVLLSR